MIMKRQSDRTGNRHLWEINWFRDLFVLVLLVAGIGFIWWLRSIFAPVFLALFLAYLINPLILWCEDRWKCSRDRAVSVVFGVLVLLLVVAVLVVVPLAIGQVSQLVARLPDYLEKLATDAGISNEEIVAQLKQQGNQIASDPMSLLPYLWRGTTTTVGVVYDVVSAMTGLGIALVLLPVCFAYFTWKWPETTSPVMEAVPKRYQDRATVILGKMDQAVGSYFRIRLLIALIMGVMYSVGWGIAGVPYWFLLGMMGGLLGIIPYAAGFAWLAAMLFAYLDLHNGFSGLASVAHVFVWPSLVYGIVQASDDWLLTPFLQGRELNLSLVAIILCVLVGGSMAGLFGMMFAVPVFACLRVLWEELSPLAEHETEASGDPEAKVTPPEP